MKTNNKIFAMNSKIFLLLTLLLFLSCCYSKQPVPTDGNAKVLVCTGHYSKRFHSHICKGMKACKGEVEEVNLSDAKEMGLTPCGYCYKKYSKSDPHYYDDWDD